MNSCLYKGFWSLVKDSSDKIKTMERSLRTLHKNLPEIFPIPPEEKNNKCLVYISNDSSEEIERSAEAIRNCLDYPFIMYYVKKPQPPDFKNIIQYMHTPYHELYEFHIDTSINCRRLIGKKAKSSVAFDALIPSQVTDRDHIHLPTNQEDFEKVNHGKGGKWMVHCSDLETLDSFWKSLTRLYERGILVGLKSCTASFSPSNPNYTTKVIMCYTADADCKSSVRVAAEIISICTGYNDIMYYKSNEASWSGKYRHEGFKGVTKYMFTDTSKMFERDFLRRWKVVIFNEEKV